ncbi:ABC transporter ATP-binding protein [Candidatus Bipolaricaulota bacterium]|nr:ABC transporter ATP-binding protein [Candidatus Bipolaricaulota bacterium]
MSNNIAIRVENLSKRYRIGQYVGSGAQYKTLRESLTNAVSAPLHWLRQTGDRRRKTDLPSPAPRLRSSVAGQPSTDGYIWALKDVSFEVGHGEVVGIIGRNGAGKSTLLKVLTRITEPTEGRAELSGRVGSLLEVGTGFHPELTGRENVYLSGAILGMARKEIDRKFDEIVDFSGVEKFIDTPVKRYSSGMRVRLGFAVAAHLEPEILLIDEVLAVGDVAFQKKCLGKMEDVARGGRTVLFVSHNMGMITILCEKAILLTEGRIDFMGPAQQTVSTYLANFSADAGLKRRWSFEEAPGEENVKIRSVAITDHLGIEKPYFSTAEPIFVTIEYWVLADDIPVNVGFSLLDKEDNWVCAVGNYEETRSKPIRKSGLYRSKCTIPGNLLNSGRHSITVTAVRNLTDLQVRISHCVAFEAVDDRRVHPYSGRWGGIIKPEFEWHSEKVGDVGGEE